ncbi:MAG: hypothetical protein KC619_02760 [Myxococcales bacterium]|nr:hypothetical protein [Myxococcales bacterium]
MPPLGSSLVYGMSGSGLEGTMELELLGWEPLDGEWEGRWRVRQAADGQPPATSEIRRRCSADALEEAWETPDLLSPLVSATNRTWRWPSALSPGVRFSGTIDLSLGRHRGRVARTHEVVRREMTHVPAGTFDAWKVAVEDRYGERETSSEVWVADGVGMIRMIQHMAAGTLTYELLER